MSPDNPDNSDTTTRVTQEIKSLIPALQQFADRQPMSQAYEHLAEAVVRELMTVVERGEGYKEARQVIQSHQHLTALWESALGEFLTKLEGLEQARIRREKYTPGWWSQTVQSLQQAFDKDPTAAYKQWMILYAQALVDWELETCGRLVSTTFAYPRDQYPNALLIRYGNESLQDKDYPVTLPMLNYLVSQLTDETEEDLRLLSALLSIFIGRIHLYQLSESELARQTFDRAAAMAPRDGRPLAALGHLALEQNDLEEAYRSFSRAIEFSPNQPEGYVGKAMLAEYNAQWIEADEWYKTALKKALEERDVLQSLSKMLAPGSGRLYLHIAQQLLANNALDLALEAVDYCLNLGIYDNSLYPVGSAIALKAAILLAISGPEPTPEEAKSIADLYFEAGRSYFENNEFQTSVDLFKKARDLDSTNALVHFYLADNLRLLSIKSTPPYYVSADLVQESLAAWETGISLGEVINPDTSWIYIARSLISNQLALLPEENENDHSWQALLFDEQALLVIEYPEWWSSLSECYERLALYANMLYGSRKAGKGSRDNIRALESRTKALIFTGQYKLATKELDRLFKFATPENMCVYKSWSAQMNLEMGNYRQGLEDVQSCFELEPDNLDLSIRYWRALNYRALGKHQEAKEDELRIWQMLENPDYKKSYSFYAWIAYLLGMYEETIRSVEPLLVSARFEDRFDALLLLGLSFLAMGDIKAADEHLSQALNECNNPRLLEGEFIRELSQLLKLASREKWAHSKLISNYLRQPGGILELARSKQKTIKTYNVDPIKELENVLSNPVTGNPGSWSWLGAQAGLGRLHLRANHLEAALQAYTALSLYPKQVPEASLGIKKVQERM